ncbi:MAG: DUF1592 domain-containing protein, partial [Planctomycetales bacterium]
SGDVNARHAFAKEGRYTLRTRAWAAQAGPEKAKASLRLDGQEVGVLEIKAEASDPQVYEIEVSIKPGKRKFSMAFINDYYNPKDPNPNNRDRNLYIDYLEVEGPLGVRAENIPASHKKIFARPPKSDSKTDRLERAREILTEFVARAYRRPAAPSEIDRLLKFVELVGAEGGSFERSVQLAMQAVLISPRFLFRVELDRTPDGSPHPISEFELASRLSYFLWSSMPDDELFELAGQGKLRNPDVLAAQLRRMIADPKADAMVENFAGQWLQLRNLDTVSPDPKRFPTFAALKESMRTETEMFFASVMREDRNVLDLLDADYTFVNEALAKHYGISGLRGKEFRRVSLKGLPRGGVLTQASVLTVTSNPTRTNPVKRGKWVLQNLLGTPPPPPPPNVELLNEDENELTGTLRERMIQHRRDPNCAICHARMDPIGFGLENFDAIGAWRTHEGKFKIDPSGKLPDGRDFSGPSDLKQVLGADKNQFVRCLVEKMLTYALGRGLEYYDKCAVDEIVGQMAANEYKASVMIHQIIVSKPFQMRRGK